MDKSFSASKKNNKENSRTDLRADKLLAKERNTNRFKIASKENKVETDRKSLQNKHDKSAKTIRLKTDYQDNMASQSNMYEAMMSKQQVSTKHTEQSASKHAQSNSSHVIQMGKSELLNIYKQFKDLTQDNIQLKR